MWVGASGFHHTGLYREGNLPITCRERERGVINGSCLYTGHCHQQHRKATKEKFSKHNRKDSSSHSHFFSKKTQQANTDPFLICSVVTPSSLAFLVIKNDAERLHHEADQPHPNAGSIFEKNISKSKDGGDDIEPVFREEFHQNLSVKFAIIVKPAIGMKPI